MTEHGSRWAYQAGCRCLLCSAANARYAADRRRACARGEWNGWVKPDAAKAKLDALEARQIGYRQAAKLAQISPMTAWKIRAGKSVYIRAHVERAILGIEKPSLAHGVKVNSYRTRHLLLCLTKEGYSRRDLAWRLGLQSGRLGLDHEACTVRNALKVRVLFARLTGEDGQLNLAE